MQKLDELIKLNVGCGEFYQEGWINIDIAPVKKDLDMDGRDLQFDAGRFEMVYLGHVIEHVDRDGAEQMITEAFRVLENDGALMVVAPDMDKVEQFHKTGKMPDNFYQDTLHGQQRWHGDEHLWLPKEVEIMVMMNDLGFKIVRYGIESMPNDWPIVARDGWQLAVLGAK